MQVRPWFLYKLCYGAWKRRQKTVCVAKVRSLMSTGASSFVGHYKGYHANEQVDFNTPYSRAIICACVKPVESCQPSAQPDLPPTNDGTMGPQWSTRRLSRSHLRRDLVSQNHVRSLAYSSRFALQRWSKSHEARGCCCASCLTANGQVQRSTKPCMISTGVILDNCEERASCEFVKRGILQIADRIDIS